MSNKRQTAKAVQRIEVIRHCQNYKAGDISKDEFVNFVLGCKRYLTAGDVDKIVSAHTEVEGQTPKVTRVDGHIVFEQI